ncbi:MAG TPA: hypothetical protein VE442_13560 [Jatrophihabitans sp.]|nr:hypothetical protein [Jatrophihabitans sp.]
MSSAGLVLAIFTAPATAAFAIDTPPVTGCPANNEVLSVAELVALGHHVPLVIDEAGNNNGLICAKQLAPADQEQWCLRNGCNPGDILYFFRDDDLTR